MLVPLVGQGWQARWLAGYAGAGGKQRETAAAKRCCGQPGCTFVKETVHACLPAAAHAAVSAAPPGPPQFGKWVTANATIGGKFVAATLEERNSFLSVRRLAGTSPSGDEQSRGQAEHLLVYKSCCPHASPPQPPSPTPPHPTLNPHLPTPNPPPTHTHPTHPPCWTGGLPGH